MTVLALEDMPNDLRVRLSEEEDQQLWGEVMDEGVSKTADEIGVRRSKIYNWRHKQSFYPLNFVRSFIEDPSITGLKGSSRSKVWALELPLDLSEELLTRIGCSVTTNRDGTPVYQVSDRGLAERFEKLLDSLGVPFKSYDRGSVYEVRYPVFVHRILSSLEFEEDEAALIDEIGIVTENCFVVEGQEYGFSEFEDRIYSTSLQLEVAMRKGKGVREMLG